MKMNVCTLAGVAGAMALSAGSYADLASQAALNFADVSATAGTPAGMQTWQFWVPFTSPTDNLLNVGFGDIAVDSGNFFQTAAPFGSNFPNLAFIGFEPSLAWDSWVTLEDPAMQGDTTPDADFDAAAFNTGNTLVGGWFDSNPATPVLAGIDNQVLVMQLTVNEGAFINGVITAFTGDGSVFQEYIVTNVPGPGALALLGVAGLVGARRRRA